MKRFALLAIVALFTAAVAQAGNKLNLQILIDQNIRNAARSYQALLPAGEGAAHPARLWIHVRVAAQERIAQQIFQRLAGRKIAGQPIESRPIQMVSQGPQQSELRFFRREDSFPARELLRTLSPIIPGVRLHDLSREYASVPWIQPGHFELWLAPTLTALPPAR